MLPPWCASHCALHRKAGVPHLQELRLGRFKQWSWDSAPGSFTLRPVVIPLYSIGYPGLIENEDAKRLSQGYEFLCLLQNEMVSGFPEEQRNKAVSLALV